MNFTPAPDAAIIFNALLDTLEQRERRAPLSQGEGRSSTGARANRRPIKINLADLPLPSYFSQTDPDPRQITNNQLLIAEQAGLVKLAWLPNQSGHLLASVTLNPDQADSLFALLNRTPIASHRARLLDLLLGERFRFHDWRLVAINQALDQLRVEKSPAPFSFTDHDFNRDLLTALAALDGVNEEMPYRVFSVRVFNDSKRFDDLMNSAAILARRCQPDWRELNNDEVLRELNLVANPGHIYLHGSWQLIDEAGQVMSLGEFHPSVGLPAMQAARLQRVTVSTSCVICVENPTSFYELIRSTQSATPHLPVGPEGGVHNPQPSICLWGNPSPACRHLLRCLPENVSLQVWADIDYGGLNILAQLREQVNGNAKPYLMDIETFEAHSRWARPLTSTDVHNLNRLLRRPSLTDMQSVIAHMLQRGLKLEQEAIIMHTPRTE